MADWGWVEEEEGVCVEGGGGEASFWTQIPVCDFIIIEKLTFNPHRWKENLIVWEAGAVLVPSGERGEHLGWG